MARSKASNAMPENGVLLGEGEAKTGVMEGIGVAVARMAGAGVAVETCESRV